VTLKIIRLKHNQVPKESMSFPTFKFSEIVNQNWAESDFLAQLERKFLFIVYSMDKNENEVIFKKAFFWNMPYEDILEAKRVWNLTKQRAKEGIVLTRLEKMTKNNLPKISESHVAHVRPHGQNAKDVDILPDGRQITKQCFWLNAEYIKSQIEKNLDD
jgi:DNA mismatch repair protein MutH